METAGASDTDLAAVADDLDRLVKRLRTMSAVGWRSRRAAVIDLLEALADLSAQLEISATGRLPKLPDHSLADAVSVLGWDCLDNLRMAPDPGPSAAELHRLIVRCFRDTR